MEKRRTRDIVVMVLIGIAVITVSIAKIGFGEFMHLMSNVNKPFIPLIILLSIFNSLAFTISWKYLIPKQISFYKLFTFYIAGTSINNITPAFGAGGEPVKAILLGNETGISKAECFASVVFQRLLSMIPFLVIEIIGIGLLLYNPWLIIGRWELLALIFSVIFGICAFGLIAYFYTRKDKLSSFIRRIISFFAPLIRRVKKGFDQRAYADAVEQSVNSFYSGLRQIYSNKNSLLNALLFSFIAWVFDIMTMYVVFLSLGSKVYLSVLIITYLISMISGMITVFLPGGIGVVESTMANLFIRGGVPLEVALLATLLYRLASYWFNNILGGFYMGNSLKKLVEPLS